MCYTGSMLRLSPFLIRNLDGIKYIHIFRHTIEYL